jgi:hypothetical protein
VGYDEFECPLYSIFAKKHGHAHRAKRVLTIVCENPIIFDGRVPLSRKMMLAETFCSGIEQAMQFDEIEKVVLRGKAPYVIGDTFEEMCCWFLRSASQFRDMFNGVWQNKGGKTKGS